MTHLKGSRSPSPAPTRAPGTFRVPGIFRAPVQGWLGPQSQGNQWQSSLT